MSQPYQCTKCHLIFFQSSAVFCCCSPSDLKFLRYFSAHHDCKQWLFKYTACFFGFRTILNKNCCTKNIYIYIQEYILCHQDKSSFWNTSTSPSDMTKNAMFSLWDHPSDGWCERYCNWSFSHGSIHWLFGWLHDGTDVQVFLYITGLTGQMISVALILAGCDLISRVIKGAWHYSILFNPFSFSLSDAKIAGGSDFWLRKANMHWCFNVNGTFLHLARTTPPSAVIPLLLLLSMPRILHTQGISILFQLDEKKMLYCAIVLFK